MSWFPGFATPWFALLFLLLVPLIIFYFLKLKRPRLEIASLALWRQVISDQRVNSPFQKFKRNLLLLLQIALLCLLALAAMQPFLQGSAERAEYLPLLIDCSASMGATDEQSGKTRLDLARQQVREIIEGLLPGQKLTLIAVNNTARRLTDFTDNKPVLLNALDRIEATDVPSKLEDGLQLAQALSRTFLIDKVRLYSDGNLPTRPDPHGRPIAVVDFDLPFEMDFHQLDPAGANIGITAFNARRATVERWDVFVRVECGQAGSTAGQVELYSNGQPVGAPESVVLDKGESQRLVFKVDASEPAFLEARLKPDGFDSLDADNSAFLDLPVGRELNVYCAPGLASYRHSLGSLEGLLLEPGEDGSTTLSSFDLVLSDSLDDLSREAGTFCFVGVVPEDLASLLKVETGLAEVVDWKRDAPLLQHVQLKEVQISDLPKKLSNVEDGDFEQLGYEILAFGNEGPLILRKRDGPRLYYYLLFHTDRSTLPYRVGFPILVQNIINEALQQAALSELAAVPTGILPPLNLKAGESYTIAGPDNTVEHTANERGLLDGVAAPHVGRYDVKQGGNVVKRVGASLLNPTETSLAAVDEIQFRELKVSAEEEKLKSDKPLWPKLALAAFGMLLLEWWYFQKKPAGMPA
jgi:hypothetical protein